MTQQPPSLHPIPRRHGIDMKAARRIARSVRWATKGDPEPDEQRWQDIGEALLIGDAPMDELVAWMADYGMAAGRKLFQQALEHGIDSVADAPAPLRTLFAAVDQRPDWLDDDLLKRGAEACNRGGLMSMRALRDAGLMAGYQASAINKTLVLTGSLERGPQRRLAETTMWWIDCTGTDGMQRFGAGFKSTLHVRFIHALIRRRLRNMPEWDSSQWGLPINQTDMAATHLAFSVIYLLAGRVLGVPYSRDEGFAVMHLWRYIDWLMGVEERWLPATEQQGRTLLYQILLSQAPPDASSKALGSALKNEPLARHYPHFAWLRGRYERARHLSIDRLFLDRQGMRDLGLPPNTLPWYPAIASPVNLIRHKLRGAVPGGRERLVRSGRREQVEYLKILFGADRPRLHSAAEH